MFSTSHNNHISFFILPAKTTGQDSVFFKVVAFLLFSPQTEKSVTESQVTIEVVINPRVGHSWESYSWVGHLLVVEPFYSKPIIP